MDLSGIIFVALAIGWAVYLVPKALQREDERALSRPVDTFSDSMRVLGRKPGAGSGTASGAPGASDTAASRPAAPARPRYRVSRAAARAAARRRRRVLAVLLVALLATVGTSWFLVTPWLSTAIPGGLIVAFLVVARLTVRAQQARRFEEHLEEMSGPIEGLPQNAPSIAKATEADLQPELTTEETVTVSRDELAAQVAAPTTDAGGLWDPLPITLPTYVTKPRAARTVRTIELTGQGVTSSGHDAADSALARKAEEEKTEQQAAKTSDSTDGKKVANG